MKPNQICMCSACGTTGKGNRRGSGGIEVCLWLFLLWPIALVYTVWRSSGAACPICGSQAIVPVSSPVAAQISQASPIVGAQMEAFIIESKLKAENQSATDAMIWKCVLWFCGILVVGGCAQIFGGEYGMQIIMIIAIVTGLGYMIRKSQRKENNK